MLLDTSRRHTVLHLRRGYVARQAMRMAAGKNVDNQTMEMIVGLIISLDKSQSEVDRAVDELMKEKDDGSLNR